MDNSVIGNIRVLDNLIAKIAFEQVKSLSDGSTFCPSPLQFIILKYLIDNIDKEVNQKMLENKLSISKAAISNVIVSMEKQGTIIKCDSLKDKRLNILKITPKGIEFQNKMLLLHKKTNELLVKDISQEDLEVFFKVISKMQNNLKIKENI